METQRFFYFLLANQNFGMLFFRPIPDTVCMPCEMRVSKFESTQSRIFLSFELRPKINSAAKILLLKTIEGELQLFR